MSDIVQSVKRQRRDPETLKQDPRKLKRRRVAAGMSLTEAAQRAPCSKPHLSNVENGYDGASPRLLAKLAGLYGCQIVDLMPDEPKKRAA
jgi:transcriptional regulator with XRE-family HTH domain